MADFQSISNLSQLGKVPVDMTIEAHNAFLRGQQADQVGLQELMRKQAYEQQMDPMLLAHQNLVNKGLIQDQQKGDFALRSLGRSEKMDEALWDQTKSTQLQKLLAQEGEDKAKVFQSNVYSQLQQTRPGTPEHKKLMGMLETTQDFVKSRREHQERLAEIGATSAGQQKVMQMQIDAGRFAKPDRSNILVRLRSAKNSLEKAEILEQAYYEAIRSQDPAAQEYAQRALEARQRAAEEARNRGAANPGINISEVSGLPASPAPSASAPIAGKGGTPSFDAEKERRYQEWVKQQQGK